MRRDAAIIVGLGQDAAGDDGVGPAVAAACAARGLEARACADASLVLGLLEAGRRVIVVDAVVGGGAPGTVLQLSLADVATGPAPLSSHGLGLVEAVMVAKTLGLPAVAGLVVLGVVIEPPRREAFGLTPAVAAAVEPTASLAAALAADR